MKNFKIFYFFALLLTISFVISCNIEPYEGDVPENSNQGENNNEPGVLKMDFDGQTFKADNSVATVLESVINISGFKTNTGEVVILTIFGNSVGTYQLGVTQNQVEVSSATYRGNGDTWSSVKDFITSQGEITITEIDRENKTFFRM